MIPDSTPADAAAPDVLMAHAEARYRAAADVARTYPGAGDALVRAIVATGLAFTRTVEAGAVRREAGTDPTVAEVAWEHAAIMHALSAHQLMEAEAIAGAAAPDDTGGLGPGFAVS